MRGRKKVSVVDWIQVNRLYDDTTGIFCVAGRLVSPTSTSCTPNDSQDKEASERVREGAWNIKKGPRQHKFWHTDLHKNTYYIFYSHLLQSRMAKTNKIIRKEHRNKLL